MGAWGCGSFDNDDALDWAGGLTEEGDSWRIDAALSQVTDEAGHYIDADSASQALAAAEVVAALQGKPAPGLPMELRKWVKRHPKGKADWVSQARRATAAVLKQSELRALWQESDEFERWQSAVNDLLNRLTVQ